MTANEIRTALLNDIERWVDTSLFGKNPKFLHVVIINNGEDMLEVARQMVLLAHFPSFDEKNPETCTKISILGNGDEYAHWKTALGNLLECQKYRCANGWIEVPLDVQIEFVDIEIDKESEVNLWIKESKQRAIYHQVIYDKSKIEDLSKTKVIKPLIFNREDVAMLANSVYEVSRTFEIIRSEDTTNVEEYEIPIKNFIKNNINDVKNSWDKLDDVLKESNRYLADSLYVRWVSLEKIRRLDIEQDIKRKDNTILETLKKHLSEMSSSEHARWNVEKLINGFRPYTYFEVIEDENLCNSQARTNHINYMKKEGSIKAHLDLCSYNRLRRIDYDAIKYDSFLLLAMIKYLEE